LEGQADERPHITKQGRNKWLLFHSVHWVGSPIFWERQGVEHKEEKKRREEKRSYRRFTAFPPVGRETSDLAHLQHHHPHIGSIEGAVGPFDHFGSKPHPNAE